MIGLRTFRICVATAALILPCIAVLWVPFFNVIEPRVYGLPFFYAYQLLWVPVSAICIGIAYHMYESRS